MNKTSNNTCTTQEKIKAEFYNDVTGGNLFFSDLSLYVDSAMKHYNKPIASSLVNSFQMLNLDTNKRKIVTYKTTAIHNDVGWFFEDVKEESLINVNDILTDFTLIDRWNQSVLYNSVHYMGRKVETYRRSYTKIQEVFATIGGFAKFFHTILLLFFSKVRKVYNNLILINSLSFNEDSLSVDSINDLKAKPGYNQVSKYVRTDIFASPNKNSKFSVEKSPVKAARGNNLSYYDYICNSFFKKRRESANESAYKKLEYYNRYKAFFYKKLDITCYFDIHNKISIIKKVLFNKDYRFMMKFVHPKLKSELKYVNNYSGLDNRSILNNSMLAKQNLKLNSGDEKYQLLIQMMQEDYRKNFEL